MDQQTHGSAQYCVNMYCVKIVLIFCQYFSYCLSMEEIKYRPVGPNGLWYTVEHGHAISRLLTGY